MIFFIFSDKSFDQTSTPVEILVNQAESGWFVNKILGFVKIGSIDVTFTIKSPNIVYNRNQSFQKIF